MYTILIFMRYHGILVAALPLLAYLEEFINVMITYNYNTACFDFHFHIRNTKVR